MTVCKKKVKRKMRKSYWEEISVKTKRITAKEALRKEVVSSGHF